jgi:hypothetical protein
MRPTPPSLALAVSLALAFAALGAPPAGGPSRPASAQQTELVIEILPDRFNPRVCTVNRNARIPVTFVNRDTKPRRVVVDELYAPEPGGFARDTGWIAPGEASRRSWSFGEVQDLVYRDHDDPALTGRIIVPLSNNAATECGPDSLSGADPGGGGCGRLPALTRGCGVLPSVAADGPRP